MHSSFSVSSPPAVASLLAQVLPGLRREPLVDPGAWRSATARLLCGDFEVVRALLADAAPHPALPLLVARYHAWTGDLQLVMGIFDRVRASLPLLEDRAELRAITWPELQKVATDIGDPVLAARLVRLAREEPHSDGVAASGAAADLIAALHDLLGPEPDAHRGRLRLRPAPAGHDDIRVTDLRFADGSVSLTARRAGNRLEYTVVQEAGAIPFTLLLEPVVQRRVLAAEVDGVDAQLDVRRHGPAAIVPVQLVLDQERSLTLVMGPE